MQEQPDVTPADREVEEALRALRPNVTGLCRDNILRETYQRASRRQTRVWRGVAAGLAAGLVLSNVLRPRPQVVERVVYVPKATAAAEEPPPGASDLIRPPVEPVRVVRDNYLSLRREVLVYGLAALPRGAAPTQRQPRPDVPPPESHNLLDFLHPFQPGAKS